MTINQMSDMQLEDYLNYRWAAAYAAQADLHNAKRHGDATEIELRQAEYDQAKAAVENVMAEWERRKNVSPVNEMRKEKLSDE